MSEPTPWQRRWWPIWVAIVTLGFAVPQTTALLAGGDGDGFIAGTFSETLGGWLGTSDGTMTGAWVAFTAALVALVVWWPAHAARRWPWERPPDDGG